MRKSYVKTVAIIGNVFLLMSFVSLVFADIGGDNLSEYYEFHEQQKQEQIEGLISAFQDFQEKHGLNPEKFDLENNETNIIETMGRSTDVKESVLKSRSDVTISSNTVWSTNPGWGEMPCPSSAMDSLTIDDNVTLTIKGCTNVVVNGNVGVYGKLSMSYYRGYRPTLKTTGNIVVADYVHDSTPALLELRSGILQVDGVIWIDDYADMNLQLYPRISSYNELKPYLEKRWPGVVTTNNLILDPPSTHYYSSIYLKHTKIYDADWALNVSWWTGSAWMAIYNNVYLQYVQFHDSQYAITLHNNYASSSMTVDNCLFSDVKNYYASPSVNAFLVGVEDSHHAITISDCEDEQNTTDNTQGYGFWISEPEEAITISSNEISNVDAGHIRIIKPKGSFDINGNTSCGTSNNPIYYSIYVDIDDSFAFTSDTISYIRNNNLGTVASPLGNKGGIWLEKTCNDIQDAEAIIYIEDNIVRFSTTPTANNYGAVLMSGQYPGSCELLEAYYRDNEVYFSGVTDMTNGVVLQDMKMGTSVNGNLFSNNTIQGNYSNGVLIKAGEGEIADSNIVITNTYEYIRRAVTYFHFEEEGDATWTLTGNEVELEDYDYHVYMYKGCGCSDCPDTWDVDASYDDNCFLDCNANGNFSGGSNCGCTLSATVSCP